jgi:bifunctional ADP-heptose synthase (sugar kinase/adenylyltransferase)
MNIHAICLWLCTASTRTGGEATSAEIIIQILQSTMMHKLLGDPNVCSALTEMTESQNVHIGLDAVNQAMATSTDEIAVKYMDVLRLEHEQLIDPPFTSGNSLLWHYRPWTVSHFNNLLVIV